MFAEQVGVKMLDELNAIMKRENRKKRKKKRLDSECELEVAVRGNEG